MRRCYFSKNYTNINSAGNKAKTDVEQIMTNLGFVNVGLKQSINKNKVLGFILTLVGVTKTIFTLQKGDLLVLQYPLKKYYTFICKVAHFKGAYVITLIHDLGSFRRKKLTPGQEYKRLSNTDYIIALNESMKSWLINNGYKQPIGVLGIWDYLSDAKPNNKNKPANVTNIMHAGSVSPKTHSFIYKLDKEIVEKDSTVNYNMYGKNFDYNSIIHKDKFADEGFAHPDSIISRNNAHFGLVWYGHSIHEIDGVYGEYFQITTPHKPSLYMRCNIPIIIWDKMALASFVKEHNIGICISSLRDLYTALNAITEEQYQIMKQNTIELSNKISTGYFFTKAFIEAESKIKAQSK